MRKKFYLIPVLICLIIFTGCGGKDSQTARSDTGNMQVEDVIKEQIAITGPLEYTSEEGKDAAVEENPETDDGDEEASDLSAVKINAEADETKSDVDVDLTRLSSTMVYSEVYNMTTIPSDYRGKSVRMEGTYSFYHDEESGNNYYACIIRDAAACCAQGIEFVLKDGNSYPDFDSDEFIDITVVGTFDTYIEDGLEYCTLRDAVLE